jgi:hypothetical protein
MSAYNSPSLPKTEVEIERCEYGKFCDRNGVVLTGADHRVLGVSGGFGEELRALSNPTVLKVALDQGERRRERLFDRLEHTTVFRMVRGNDGAAFQVLFRFRHLHEGGDRDGAKCSRPYIRGRVLRAPQPETPLPILLAAMDSEKLVGITREQAAALAPLRTPYLTTPWKDDPFLEHGVIYAASGVPIHLAGEPAEWELFVYADALREQLPVPAAACFGAGWNLGSSVAAGLSISWGPVRPSNAASFDIRRHAWVAEPRTTQVRSGRELACRPYDPQIESVGRQYASFSHSGSCKLTAQTLPALIDFIVRPREESSISGGPGYIADLLDPHAVDGLRSAVLAGVRQQCKQQVLSALISPAASDRETVHSVASLSDSQKGHLLEWADQLPEDQAFHAEALVRWCLNSSPALSFHVARHAWRWRTRVLAWAAIGADPRLLELMAADANVDGCWLCPDGETMVGNRLRQLLPAYAWEFVQLARAAHNRFFERWLSDNEEALAVAALAQPTFRASFGGYAWDAADRPWSGGVRCAVKLAEGALPDAADQAAWEALDERADHRWRQYIFGSRAWAEVGKTARHHWQPVLAAKLESGVTVAVHKLAESSIVLAPSASLRPLWLDRKQGDLVFGIRSIWDCMAGHSQLSTAEVAAVMHQLFHLQFTNGLDTANLGPCLLRMREAGARCRASIAPRSGSSLALRSKNHSSIFIAGALPGFLLGLTEDLREAHSVDIQAEAARRAQHLILELLKQTSLAYGDFKVR